MKKSKSYNELLACMEGIACVAIVFLHCSNYPGPIGDLVNLGSRFAVPLFYIVSGFYLFPPDARAAERQQRLRYKIRHIFWMVLVSSALYLGYLLITRKLLDGASVKGMWLEYFGLRDTVMWVLFNRVPFASHLWFLYALLYVYLILYGLTGLHRKWAEKILQSDLLPFGLVCIGILLRFLAFFSPAQIWYFSVADTVFYRNWLFIGLPFVLIGSCLRRHQADLMRCRMAVVLALCGAGILLTVLEWRIYLALFHTYPELYLGTIVLTVALMTLTILCPEGGKGTVLAKFGRQFPMPVYIIHVMMLWLLSRVYGACGGDMQNPWFTSGRPFFVLVLSLLVSALYLWARGKVRPGSKG